MRNTHSLLLFGSWIWIKINATSSRGQLCRESWLQQKSSAMWKSGGSDQFSDTDLVDWHFHCHDKVTRVVWLGCIVPQSVWVEWLQWLEGRNLGWFIFATPPTWFAASTMLHPHHHYHHSPLNLFPLNLDPIILSHEHPQSPSSFFSMN